MSLFVQEGGTPNTLYFDHDQFQTLPKMKWQPMNGTHQQEFLSQVNHKRSHRLLKKEDLKWDTL